MEASYVVTTLEGGATLAAFGGRPRPRPLPLPLSGGEGEGGESGAILFNVLLPLPLPLPLPLSGGDGGEFNVLDGRGGPGKFSRSSVGGDDV